MPATGTISRVSLVVVILACALVTLEASAGPPARPRTGPWPAALPRPTAPLSSVPPSSAPPGRAGSSTPPVRVDFLPRFRGSGRYPTAPGQVVNVSLVLRLAGPVPATGPGTFAYARGAGPVLGRAGTLRRFRIAVERGVPEDTAVLAATVDATLADPRGWTAGGRLRLQRVPPGARSDFTIYLATAGTARRMCAAGGVDIRVGGRPYTSCRTFGRVILNLDRWRLSAPEYARRGVSLARYRAYMINHEVGHQLGHRHEACPRAGRPAPVMLQQTLGLHGCTPYEWPYLAGHRYAGPRT